MAIAGPAGRCARKRCARLEVVADTYLSVSTPVQHARARRAGPRGGAAGADPRRGLRANLALLRDAAAGTRRDRARRGGRLVGRPARARHPHRRRVGASASLEHDGVLVHPGYFFDFPREAYLVLSLLPPSAAFAEGVAADPGAGRGSA